MFRRLLFFSILILPIQLSGFRISFGQEYSWKNYSVADGLPQTQIYSLFQDSKGFIWIGTKGGLSKFDGVEFKNYTTKNGLTFDYITDLSEDASGNIIIANRGGVNKITGGDIDTLFLSQKLPISVSLIDEENNIWFSPFTKREYKFYKNGKENSEHPIIRSLREGEIIFYGIKNHPKNTLYFLTDQGRLLLYENKKVTVVWEKTGLCQPFFDSEGNLYASLNDSLFSYDQGKFDFMTSTKGMVVKRIQHKDEIYLTDLEACSSLFFYDGKQITKFEKDFNLISQVLVDDEDNIWVGTDSGLWRLNNRGFQNFLFEGKNFYTWSVLEDNQGNYFFGSFLHGLKKYDGKMFSDVSTDSFFKGIGIQFFYSGGTLTDDKDILFATARGVLKYDGNGFSWIYEKPLGDAIMYILKDGGKDYFYAASAVHGLIEFDTEGLIKIHDDREARQNTGLVTSVLKDKYDRIWISGKQGISIKEHDAWRDLPDEKDNLKIGAISMIKDRKGNIWLGSNDGVYMYDYDTLIQVAGDVFSEQIGVLNITDDNELLIGSIRGIGLLDLNNYYNTRKAEVRYFDSENGFIGTECKHNSSFKDSKGDIWICTSDGVVKIDTKELKTNPVAPRVYIKNISTLSGKMEWIPKLTVAADNTKYVLEASDDDLRFYYHGLSHSAPNGVVYQTMLEGYDKDWSAITTERYRTYTNLPHGEYTFKVKAANIDGVWTEEAAVLELFIRPEWYELAAVKFSGLIGLAFLAAAIGYIYSEQNRKRKVISEQNDREIAKLQFKSLQGLIDPHFTFNAINSIASMVYRENREEAYHYFTKFAKLIRTAFDYSTQTTRSIKDEISFVTNYLDIEKMRFKDRFDYLIETDRNINSEWKIPKMIIQIYVENAIKHGLLHKEKGGELKIYLGINKETLIIIIHDNGVGRQISGLVKDESASLGKGTRIMQDYFELLNKFNYDKISSETQDLFDESGSPSGTQVTVIIPFNFKYAL